MKNLFSHATFVFSGGMRLAARFIAVSLAILFLFSCRGSGMPRRPLYVFAAACLYAALADFEKSFEQMRPETDLRVEISGSLVAARKISEYGRVGDVVLSADKRIIESLLIPKFASWQLVFASNEIVLAYSENSLHAAEVNSANWPQVLCDPRVRIARVDENLSPLGYQTLLVWKLADAHYREQLHGKSLFETLSRKVSPGLIRPDAAELLPVLGTEADYIFTYRSTARDHNLKHIILPPEVNLSSFAHESFYSKASVTISAAPGSSLTIRGEPILFSLTIPRDAPNKSAALSFVKMLLESDGRAILQRHGFSPVIPPRFYGPPDAMPETLRSLLSEPIALTETTK